MPLMAVCVRPLPGRQRPADRRAPPPEPPSSPSPPPSPPSSPDAELDAELEEERVRVETARRQLEMRLPSFLVGRTVLRPRSKAMWEATLRGPAPRVRHPPPLAPPPSADVPPAPASAHSSVEYSAAWMEESLLYARALAQPLTAQAVTAHAQTHEQHTERGLVGVPLPPAQLVRRHSRIPPFPPPAPPRPPPPAHPATGPAAAGGERRGTDLKASLVKKLSTIYEEGPPGGAVGGAGDARARSWSAAWGVSDREPHRRLSTASAATGVSAVTGTSGMTGASTMSALGVPGGMSPIGPFLQAPFPLTDEQPPLPGAFKDVPVSDESRPSMGVRWGWGSSQRSLLRRTSTWLQPRPALKPCTRRFPTHSVYEGEWHQLLRTFDGRGRLRLPNKVEYEGAFMDGMCHGDGALVYPNGAAVVATWNRGRIVDMAYRAPNDMVFAPDGSYCRTPDRRFNREVVLGMQPACRSLLTDDEPPARPVPPGCYDAGDGIYDPAVNVVYDPVTVTVVRVPTLAEREWIIAHCRKGWDENVGHRPDIFEKWVDGPEWVPETPVEPPPPSIATPAPPPAPPPAPAPTSAPSPALRVKDETLSPSLERSEESETSIAARQAALEGREAREAEKAEAEKEMLPDGKAEEEEEEEPPERRRERLEDVFLQEAYPPPFTEDVLLRASPPFPAVLEMLIPEPETSSSEEEAEVEGGERKKPKRPKEEQKKPMTSREKKLMLKAQRLKEEMTEEEKKAEAEREEAERQLRRLERERLRRLRVERMPPWPTAHKLMLPVLEESLQERQERRRLAEESAARELLKRQEREEAMAAAKEMADAARKERERAEALEKEAKAAREAEGAVPKTKAEERGGEGEAEAGAERPPPPDDEYAGPWRHVAKRLVPHLRERMEEDRQAAATRWQEDLLQLLSERASTAGLEMSTSGYLGATVPEPDARARSSSLKIFPPGLEERARKRRAEREAKEAEEAKELAQEGSSGSVTSGPPGKPDAQRHVSMAPGERAKKSQSDRASSGSRRVNISGPSPLDDADALAPRGSRMGPIPALKSSKGSSHSSK